MALCAERSRVARAAGPRSSAPLPEGAAARVEAGAPRCRVRPGPVHAGRPGPPTGLYTEINTGTYNSEWMIVDYNNFVPGKPVPDNTLWVLETIPGMTHAEDMSHRLRAQRYWASYNRPFFQDVREASGHDGAQKSHGALYSWADNPRATIFRAGRDVAVGPPRRATIAVSIAIEFT